MWDVVVVTREVHWTGGTHAYRHSDTHMHTHRLTSISQMSILMRMGQE